MADQTTTTETPRKKISVISLVMMAIPLLILLIVAILAHLTLQQQTTQIPPVAETTNYPITLDQLTIQNIDHQWVKEDNLYKPQITITLDPSADNSGSMRLVFYQREQFHPERSNDFGDSHTFTVKQGKFQSFNSNTVTITCSTGFAGAIQFHSMRNDENAPFYAQLTVPSKNGTPPRILATHNLEP